MEAGFVVFGLPATTSASTCRPIRTLSFNCGWSIYLKKKIGWSSSTTFSPNVFSISNARLGEDIIGRSHSRGSGMSPGFSRYSFGL